MRTLVWLRGGAAQAMVAAFVFWAAVPTAHVGAESQTQLEGEWTPLILMKLKGDVGFDREGFVTTWPGSADMLVVVKSAPATREDRLPRGPTATGWLLPLPPTPGLGVTQTRVRLSPTKEGINGWEFKDTILITPKEALAGHYPKDVVFEVQDAGPGYRLELRNFRSARGLQFQAMPALFAPGAEHQIVGRVEFANMVITGEESYPLTFRFTQTGYEYLYGRGRVKVGASTELSFGERDSLDYWTSRAGSSEDRTREAAASVLGFLPKENSEKQAALAALRKLAEDPVASVRRNAAESLGRLKYSGAEQLLKTMSTTDKDEWVRKVAAWAGGKVMQTGGMSATTP